MSPGPRVGALLSALILAAWAGIALYFTAVVTRAAFTALPSRSLAGALVGRTLPAVFVLGAVAGAAAALIAARGSGRFRTARLAGGVVIAVSCLASQLVVAPRIERLRASLGTSLDALSPNDPGRVAFGRLHGLSVAALGVAWITATGVMVLSARDALGG